LHVSDIITGLQLVVLPWNIFEGYHFVGPFAAADEAETWIDDYHGDDPFWAVKLLDPAAPLEVRAPGNMPKLGPNPEELPWWAAERQADVGDFYLLMVDSDPPYLVGPFREHWHASVWLDNNPALSNYGPGLHGVWLADPAARAELYSPAEGVGKAPKRG
jgi:hypothetical protein